VKRLFVITFTARPGDNTPASLESGGAYINAWVDASTREEALDRAQRGIRDAEWIVESVEDVALLSRADYEGDHTGLQYFDQALIDKEVLVFHTWPVEPQEGDPVQ
jgi:hypothetical protein